MSRKFFLAPLAAAIVCVTAGASSAQAMTAQECYNTFRAERKTGDLKKMDYQSFKSARCALDMKAPTSKASATNAAPATVNPAQPAQQGQEAPASTVTAPTAAAPVNTAPRASNNVMAVATGNAVFPAAVSAQYNNLKAGRARMQTCLDQYRANKLDNKNGGLRWIQKGGGYYSECNRRLK